MALVWSQIIRLSARRSVEQMHPDDLEQLTQDRTVDVRLRRNLGGWQDHVDRMADDLRQHGYSEERHGRLHLSHSAVGTRLSAAPGESFGNNDVQGQTEFHHHHLVKALQQAGHGPVPVHVEDSRPDPNESKRYWHGTTAEGLESVEPNHGASGNFGQALHEPGHAYATKDIDHAWSYAERLADAQGGVPHVYEVHPTGPVEKDPQWDAHGNLRGNFASDVRSRHPFRVIAPPLRREGAAQEPWRVLAGRP